MINISDIQFNPITDKHIQFQNQLISVKQYIPFQNKMELISTVLNAARDEEVRFYNPCKLEFSFVLQVVAHYTDLNLLDDLNNINDENNEENPNKLFDYYDLLVGSSLYNRIIKNIPESEIEFLRTAIEKSIAAIYAYSNSVMGVLKDVTENYSELSLDADAIKNKIADGENLELLQQLIPLLNLT